MATTLESSIVRIRTHDNVVVGAGFLVTEKRVLTCAHVVAQALNIPQDTSEIPSNEIFLDFPLVAANRNLTAKVVKWLPVQPDGSGDIACLELLGKPPKEAHPVLLITEDKLWGHPFRAFGFPAGYDNGVWTSGVLRAKQADGWIQIEDVKQTGYFIEPGFSGTAIWDEEVNGVVGMTAVAERRPEVRAAFAIPISLILDLLPELEQQTIPPCPYRGLFAFREQDARFFFGREAYTEKLVEAVQKQPLIAVIGASGSGKSSVVYAGLIPYLRRQGNWLITSFRPGDSPFRTLSAALVPFLEPDLDEIDKIKKIKKLTHEFTSGDLNLSDIVDAIAQKHPESRLLLFADQFEELYTLCHDDDERRRFLDELLSILPISPSPHLPIFSLVLTMRADFWGKAISYRPFADVLQNANLILSSMNREELPETIENPTKMLGVEVEDGLADRILDAVSSEPGNLPLLEFALTELWKRQHGRMLTHTAYDEIGGVERALTSYAESFYESLDAQEKERAKHIFVQLVRPGEGTEDIRRVARCADVGEENWELVTKLADARLVVTGGSQMDATSESGAHLEENVEVIHEAMIKGWQRLREWVEADREFRTWQERLRAAMRQWNTSNHDEGALLRGAPLAEAEQWLEQRRNDLNQDEQHFIETSVQLRDREVRARKILQRRITIGLVTGLIIAVALALFAAFQWNESEEQRQRAERYLRQSQINEIEALNQTSKTLLLAHDELNALLTTVKASRKLQQITVPTTIKNQVLLNLREIVFGIHEKNLLYGHQDVESVAFSPDGRLLASTSGITGSTVKLWNIADSKELMTLQHIGACSVAFSPDGDLLASGGLGTNLVLWRVADGKRVRTLEGVEPVAFSPDGTLLASGGKNSDIGIGEINLWNVADGRALMIMEEDTDRITSIGFNPNGTLLASRGFKGTITLWNVADRNVSSTLKGPESRHDVGSLAFTSSDEGTLLASAGGEQIKLWHIADPTRPPDTQVFHLDKERKLWGTADNKELQTLEGNSPIAFNSDGTLLASGEGKTIKLWNFEDTDVSYFMHATIPFTILTGHTDDVRSLAFNPDSTLLASGSLDDTIRLWQVGNIEEPKTMEIGRADEFAFSSDGTRLASVDYEGKVILWNAIDGSVIRILKERHERASFSIAVAFSPDGTLLAVSQDKTITVWNIRDGKELRTLEGDGPVAFSPDGTLLVSGSGDEKTITLWRVADGHVINTLEQIDPVYSVAFSPDGTLLVSGSGTDIYGEITLWDVADGKQIRTLKGHSTSVDNITFSSDGTRLASGSLETIILWNVADGRVISTLRGHTKRINNITFSPDGNLLASGSGDESVKLWNVADGQELITLRGHSGQVKSVAFSHDGTRLASASSDGTIKLWNLDLNDLLVRGCEWLQSYLKNPNAPLSAPDRAVCDDTFDN